MSELLESHPCSEAARSLLRSWGARPEVLNAPPGPGAEERYRVSTSELGVWIVLDLKQDQAPVLTLVRAEGAERFTFNEECRRTESEGHAVRLPDDANVFTDADLRGALRSGRATVVYVWSPHMSLSVDGYAEIATACEALGLELVTVLFPGGDREFAAREAARAGIPAEGLREAASVELIYRDVHVHAPAIVVFDGEHVSPVLPGYRDAAGYQRFLEGFLGE